MSKSRSTAGSTVVFPKRPPAAREVREVLLKSIEIDGANRRADVDEARTKELLDSMNAEGQILPIAVMDRGKAKKFLLIFGHRRLAAARHLGWTKISAAIYPKLSEDTLFDMRVTENLMREDLSPMDQAKLFGELHVGPEDAPGLDVKEMAARFFKSETYIRQRLDLLRLDTKLHPYVASGRIPLAHACLIARIGDKAKHVGFAKSVMGTGYNEALGKTTGDYVVPLKNLRSEMQRAMQPMGGAGWPWGKPYAGMRACQGCPDNTATEPELFVDVSLPGKSKKGNCTNKRCYEAKMKQRERDAEKKRKAEAKEGKKPKPKKAARDSGVYTPPPFPDPGSKHYLEQVYAVALWEFGQKLAGLVTDHAEKGLGETQAPMATLEAATWVILSYDGGVYLPVDAPVTALKRLFKLFADHETTLALARTQAAKMLKMGLKQLVGGRRGKPSYSGDAPLDKRIVLGIDVVEALANRWKVKRSFDRPFFDTVTKGLKPGGEDAGPREAAATKKEAAAAKKAKDAAVAGKGKKASGARKPRKRR